MGLLEETGAAAGGKRYGAAQSEQRVTVDSGCRNDRDPEKPIALLAGMYDTVRARTTGIVAPLEIEDYVVQTAPYMSPPRWHLGHTTWFFEMVFAGPCVRSRRAI